MNLKTHILPAFLFSLLISSITLFMNSLWEDGTWMQIAMFFVISVCTGTALIAILRAAGYAMMKSFTEPEDGPLN